MTGRGGQGERGREVEGGGVEGKGRAGWKREGGWLGSELGGTGVQKLASVAAEVVINLPIRKKCGKVHV